MNTLSLLRSGREFLLASCFLLALSGAPVAAQSPQAAPVEEEQAQSRTQVEVLEAQLETMRQYDQRLLETVYWALGVVATISLAIVALNFFNYRHDKNALSKDLEETRKNLHQEVQTEIAALAQRQQSLLQEQLEEIRQALLSDLDQRGEKLKDDLRRDIEGLRNDLHRQVEDLKSETNGRFEGSRIFNESQFDKATSEITYNKLFIYEVQSEVERIQENYIAAFQSSFRAAKLAHELGRDFFISENLNNMKRYLEECKVMHSGSISEIVDFLNQLPSKYSTEAEYFKKILKNIETI